MKVWALGVSLAVATSAYGQEADCPKIDNDLDRLACYDRTSGRTPTATTTATPNSEWVVNTKVSPLTDQKGIYAHLESATEIFCRWSKGSKAYLTLRCHENVTAATISTECHMVSSPYNDYGKVHYRVDDHPAKTANMQESTDNRSLGLWSGGKAIPFIKQLLGGQKLIVQFTPFNENTVTAEFNISGVDAAIKDLREQCKW